jgi:membrane-bound ClpP family serine protease
MKPQTLIGIILIVVAVAAFGYQGISYTSREKVIDLGPLQMTAEKTNTIPLPPIVGVVALIGGLVLLVSGSRKS